MKQSTNSFVATFKKLPANTKIMIWVQPLWAVPFSLVNSYTSLYMLNQGLSSTSIGSFNSISFIVKTLFALFAGHIVNKFGRKWVLGIVDIVGWAIPMLLYFSAHTYWQFLLATLINAITVINNVAYQCFLTEDVNPSDRIHVIRFYSIVTSLFSLFVPVTGLLVQRYTLVPAIRGLYLFAFVSMASFGVLRLIFLRETTYGMLALRERKMKPVSPLKSLIKPFTYVARTPAILLLFVVNIIINFSQVINSVFFLPYATKYIHFSESLAALFPFITTAISIAIYFLVLPLIKNMPRSILYSVAAYLAGAIFLVLAAFWGRYMVLVSVICVAYAQATVSPVLSTIMANQVADEFRADVLGLLSMLSMLFMFPVGYIGGIIYEKSPLGLMLVSAVFCLLTLLLYLLIYRKVTFTARTD